MKMGNKLTGLVGNDENRVRQTVVCQKAFHPDRRIQGDAHHLQRAAGCPVRPVGQLVEKRQLRAARRAPRCPEVDQGPLGPRNLGKGYARSVDALEVDAPDDCRQWFGRPIRSLKPPACEGQGEYSQDRGSGPEPYPGSFRHRGFRDVPDPRMRRAKRDNAARPAPGGTRSLPECDRGASRGCVIRRPRIGRGAS